MQSCGVIDVNMAVQPHGDMMWVILAMYIPTMLAGPQGVAVLCMS